MHWPSSRRMLASLERVERRAVDIGSMTKEQRKTELLRGALDLLILRTLELRPLHGVAITERIRQVTNGRFVVQPGSRFPALHRLEQDAWIAGQWTTNEDKRRVKSSGTPEQAKEADQDSEQPDERRTVRTGGWASGVGGATCLRTSRNRAIAVPGPAAVATEPGAGQGPARPAGGTRAGG